MSRKKYFGMNGGEYLAWKMHLEYQMEEDELSEKYIRENIDEVPSTTYSENQELSMDFIREFADKVSWIMISCSQKFDLKFAKEFRYKLNWSLVEENTKIEEPERTRIVKFLQNPKNF